MPNPAHPELPTPTPKTCGWCRWSDMHASANDGRGGWKTCDRVYFMEKLEINLRDLGLNLRAGAKESVQRDCADIANFAMMLADVEKPAPPKGDIA